MEYIRDAVVSGYHETVRLLILSARPDTVSNQRLAEACAAAGVDLDLPDATALVADARCGTPAIGATPHDAVLARVGNWRPDSLLALLEAVVASGAVTPNPTKVAGAVTSASSRR